MANDSKSSLKPILVPQTKHGRPTRSIKRTMGFDQRNLELTSHLPIGEREYGFIRATNNTATPYPSAQKTLDTSSLLTHIRLAQAKIKAARKRRKDSLRETHVSSSVSSASSPVEVESETPRYTMEDEKSSSSSEAFRHKRKLFDEGEFTITRGQKLGDVHHPAVVFEDIGTFLKRDTHLYSLNEMEAYCRQMNIRINKGFDPSSN